MTAAIRRIAPAPSFLVLALFVVVALAVTGCGGDDDGSSGDALPLQVDAMAPAVAAVEDALGGPQRYYEVNATPTLVNVFVAGADGAATAYVYDAVAGTLQAPSEPQPASGETFEWSQADFDTDQVLDQALEQLPSSLPRTFAVTAASPTTVQNLVTLESTQGGILDVLVEGDGTIIGTQTRS